MTMEHNIFHGMFWGNRNTWFWTLGDCEETNHAFAQFAKILQDSAYIWLGPPKVSPELDSVQTSFDCAAEASARGH